VVHQYACHRYAGEPLRFNSEDGNTYELPQGNCGVFTASTGKMFLNSAVGAAYTPLSIGSDGKAYTQNNGQLFVVGNQ
jgi:hypothetical protein